MDNPTESSVELYLFEIAALPGYALAVSQVEVVGVDRLSAYIAVPAAPPELAGLTTWKGMPLVLINLARVLKAPASGTTPMADEYLLILRTAGPGNDQWLGCAVSAPGRNVTVASRAEIVVPELPLHDRDLRAVLRVGGIDASDRIVLLLDLFSLVARLPAARLYRFDPSPPATACAANRSEG